MPVRLPAACARRYRVERALSEGGFGEVLLATQVELERPVALKLLHTDLAADPTQIERFLAEARITAALSHPHIVVVLDHGCDDGVPWIAYELLPGTSLHDRIAAAPLGWRDAALVGAQVAAALDVAHAAGVLHRDIKPHNVLEASPGHWKLTDFGIAKWSEGSRVKTATGLVIGTPPYMAPELLGVAVASPASDLYALGALLFEAVAGEPPFTGDNPVNVLRARVAGDPPPVGDRVPGLPMAFTRIVDGLLARDPARRPAPAAAVAERLREALAAPDDVPRNTGRVPVARTTERIPKGTARTIPVQATSDFAVPAPDRTVAVQPAAPPGRARALGALAALALALAAGAALAPRRVPAPPAASAAAPVDGSRRAKAILEALDALPRPKGQPLYEFHEYLLRAEPDRPEAPEKLAPDLAELHAYYQRRQLALDDLALQLTKLEEQGAGPRVRLFSAHAIVASHCALTAVLVTVSRKLRESVVTGANASLVGHGEGALLGLAETLALETDVEHYVSACFAAAGQALTELVAHPEEADATAILVLDSVGFLGTHVRSFEFADAKAPERLDAFLKRHLPAGGERASDLALVAAHGWSASRGGRLWDEDRPLAAAVARLEQGPPALAAGCATIRAHWFANKH